MSAMSTTLFNKKDAIDTLEYNNLNPEILTNILRSTPDTVKIYKDSTDMTWKFITRKRLRIYLMAKSDIMKNYEEIYWITNH